MALVVENGVLKKYTEELGDIEVVIPEGVTKIDGDVDFQTKKVILPTSLEQIEEGCFHQTAAFDGQYDNAVLVLYGAEIDLAEIFSDNVISSWLEAGSNRIDDDDMGWDRQRIGDASYEYYNEKEEEIIDGVVAEINSILKGEFSTFTYLPYYVLKQIFKAMPEEQRTKEAEDILNEMEQEYLKCFKIENGEICSYYGWRCSHTLAIPDTVSTINRINSLRSEDNITRKIIVPENVKIVPGAFLYCKELTTLDIRRATGHISIYDITLHGCDSLRTIVISDNVPNIDDLSGKRNSSQPTAINLQTIRYDGKYGVCDIECSYKNARQKAKAIKTALKMLENEDFDCTLAPAVKNEFIAAYYVKTKSPAAAEYIKENFSKIFTKKIKDGDVAFVKAIIEAGDFLDKDSTKKYIKTANTAKQTVIAALLTKLSEQMT